MNIVLRTDSHYGSWFGLRLLDEGHSVAFQLRNKKFDPLFSGMISSSGIEDDLGAADLIIYDLSGNGKEADETRKAGNIILGSSELADHLEDDRIFGLQAMELAGIKVPPYEGFDDVGEAKRFVQKTQKRYVFKPSGDEQDCSTTYVSKSPEDMIRFLDKLSEASKGAKFILQEFVSGVEVSTEGWFLDGEWYFVNHTLEEKKFLNDGLGPNTGCAGNLVWLGDRSSRLFKATLEGITPFLTEAEYVGMIDLNTIVTPEGVYGLEWTPRFGYDASPTQTLFMPQGFGKFLEAFFSKELNESPAALGSGFGASVRLSVPPYPFETEKDIYKKDLPIEGITSEDLRYFYLYDVYLDGDELKTAGKSGFIGAPLRYGHSIDEAFERVKNSISKVHIPDMQYRTDIHEKTKKRYNQLREATWIA